MSVEDEPRLSAGVVVTRRVDYAPRYLLLRAYRYWDFPKGLVEPGESPRQAAQREVAEETGINQLHFRWGDVFFETEPYRGGRKRARYYVAETETDHVHLPVSEEQGRPEHDEVRWLAYAEARKLLAARLQAVLEWADRLLSKRAR